MSTKLATVIFLLRMSFDIQRKLRARSLSRRQYEDRERRITEAVSACDPVQALKKKLNQLTEEEWNRYPWFGLPSRLRE